MDNLVLNKCKLKTMWSVAAPAVVAMILLFLGGWRSKAESFDTPGAGKEIQLEKAPASLELRLTSPPRWEKNCLVVSLDRISHSSVPVFLTSMGPYFYMALNVTSEGSAEPTTEWINIQGIVDIKSSNAYPLAPDAVAHDTYCLPSAVWVINPEQKDKHVESFPCEESCGLTYLISSPKNPGKQTGEGSSIRLRMSIARQSRATSPRRSLLSGQEFLLQFRAQCRLAHLTATILRWGYRASSALSPMSITFFTNGTNEERQSRRSCLVSLTRALKRNRTL